MAFRIWKKEDQTKKLLLQEILIALRGQMFNQYFKPYKHKNYTA
jgi:hypothetical protein